MKSIVFIVFLFIINSNLFAQVMHGKVDYKKVLKFNNNYIVFAKPNFFIWYQGQKVYSDLTPVKLNGEKIFDDNMVSSQAMITGDKTFNQYLKGKLSVACKSLPDGKYTIPTSSLVVDKNGNLAYYDFCNLRDVTNSKEIKAKFTDLEDFQKYLKEMEKEQGTDKEIIISSAHKNKVELAMYEALKSCPKFTPATKDGKPVNYFLENGFNETIIVKDKMVSFKGI